MNLHGRSFVLIIWALLLLVVVGGTCEVPPREPLERLQRHDLVAFAVPPPSRSHARGVAAPPEIAALVRDRFGAAEVTLFKLEKSIEEGDYTVKDVMGLDAAETAPVFEVLAGDDPLGDAFYRCTCDALGVRLARGYERIDFVVDCGRVLFYGGEPFGALRTELDAYLDRAIPPSCELPDLFGACLR